MQKDFLTITPDSGGGNGSLNVVATRNNLAARTSSFAVSGSGITKTIPVSQEGVQTTLGLAWDMSEADPNPLLVFQVSKRMITAGAYVVNTKTGEFLTFHDYDTEISQATITTTDLMNFYMSPQQMITPLVLMGNDSPPLIDSTLAVTRALIYMLMDVRNTSNPNIVMGHNNPASFTEASEWEAIGLSWEAFVQDLVTAATSIDRQVNLELHLPDGPTAYFPADSKNKIDNYATASRGMLEVEWF